MYKLLILGLLVTACGGADDAEGEGRTPEDYLPEGVTLADLGELTEAQELCYLHRQVATARMAECDAVGPKDWGYAAHDRAFDPWEVLSVSRQVCHNDTVTMETYSLDYAEHVPRCLAKRAAAPCEALVVPEVDPTLAHCELVTPTW